MRLLKFMFKKDAFLLFFLVKEMFLSDIHHYGAVKTQTVCVCCVLPCPNSAKPNVIIDHVILLQEIT